MKIGIPMEIKPMEARIALVPGAVAELVQAGHPVFVQAGAGVLSGYPDSEYLRAGAILSDGAEALFAQAELIVKVKEPVEGDLALLESRHLLFCYLHLAPNPTLAQRLCNIGLTGIAFETVAENGALPLLAPMSEIAGRVAVQAGVHYLHGSMGGKGILLGGVPGAENGNVVVIGAGVAGRNAAKMAAAFGAHVTAFDRSPDALRAVEALSSNITGLFAYQDSIAEEMTRADLVIGAVLIPGAKAPRLVTRDMVKGMPAGGFIADISIDQGGCIETMRATDYRNPVYLEEGIWHMGVTNMPGAVPRTASQALCGAILPYVKKLASGEWKSVPSLAQGVNVAGGKIVHPALLS